MADPTVTPARVAPAAVGAAAGAAAIVTWHEGAAYVWGWDGVHTMASPWLYRAFRGAPWPGSPGDAGFMSSLDVRTPGGPVLRPMALRLDRLHGPLWLGRIAAAPGASPSPTAGSRRRPHERRHGLVRHRRPARRGRRVGRAGRADHRAAGARRRVLAARRRPLAAGARCRVRCRGGDAAGEQAADRRHRARCDRRGDRGRPRRRCRPMAAARRRMVGRTPP